ncbi:MAG: glycosyltransferase family 9 protein [bacterium]|nr:glycosyltransferase family 9 protein [bacterium]
MNLDRLKPLEHKIKVLFFRLFSPFLKRRQEEFRPLDGNKVHRVLFLRPEKIGDMVISFPVFDGLTKVYPHIKVSILGSPRNAAIIRHDPRFERIFLYTKNLVKDIRSIRQMRKEKYDCVVDMICDDSVTALFLSQLCAPGKPRIGVGKIKFQEFYDYNYDHRKGNTGHIIENTLKLLDAFGINSEKVDGFAAPYLSDDAVALAKDFVRRMPGSNDRRIIGYNLSAGSPTRVWAEEKSVALLQKILDQSPANEIVLFTTPVERERGNRLSDRFSHRVRLIPPGMNLMQASALVSVMDLMITPDTSIVHIARAFKVDVVGLYSRFQKNFLLWRPFQQEKGAVVSNNDHNIFDIEVDDVYDMFCTVIESTGRKEGAR